MSDDKALSVHSPTGLLVPVASLEELKAAYDAKQAFVKALMVDGTDYGTIPGTGSRPTLLKPGAEKIAKLYGVRVAFHLVDYTEDWLGDDHGGEPFFYYRYRCDWVKDGELIASSEASCNSWEEKYRYRTAKPICPTCGEGLRKSKNDGGYYCWIKMGGCGATFGPDVIVGQQLGKIPNPNPADIVNTIQKMGQKRSMVSNALIVGDMSDIFTQDLEDLPTGGSPDVTITKDNPTKVPPKRKGKKKAPAKEKAKVDTAAIYDAVVNEGLAENTFAAENALARCSTGWATSVAAISWMRFYRGHRDLGKSVDTAVDLANSGQPPAM